jgi:hypothetical protein
MGHEIRFYTTEIDENALVASLRSKQGLVILRTVCLKEEERIVTDLSKLGAFPTDNQLVLGTTDHLADFVTMTYPEGHVRIVIPKSNVIEFSRSVYDGTKLRPGRLWYQPKGPSTKKPKEFLQFAKSVFTLAKQNLVAVDEPIEALAGCQAIEKKLRGELVFTSW